MYTFSVTALSDIMRITFCLKAETLLICYDKAVDYLSSHEIEATIIDIHRYS